jgi:8-hydroxy-5-deazaflavin:NADPH oxidoreductase
MSEGTPVEVIAVLGAGRVGSTVARGAIAAGYSVLVAGSDAPENIGLTVDYMIPGAQARWAADAVAEADLVILAVPFGRFPSLPLANLGGKPVLDMMNHWPPVDGDVPHIPLEASTSEAVAAAFPDLRLVKALNHIGYHEIEEDGRPSAAPDRRGVAVSSDHDEAARLVAELIDRLGFDPVLIGPLSRGILLEPGTAIFGAHLGAPEIRELLGARREDHEAAA